MILSILLVLCPIITVVFSLINLVHLIKFHKKHPIFETIAFLTAFLCMGILWLLWAAPSYEEGVLLFDLNAKIHEPLSSVHLPSYLVFLVLGVVSYFLLKFKESNWAPLLEALLAAFVIISCVISILSVLQLISGFWFEGVAQGGSTMELTTRYGPEFPDYLAILFFLVFPLNYSLMSLQLLYQWMGKRRELQEEKSYEAGVLKHINQWLLKSKHLPIMAVICILPALCLVSLLLLLFGQQPDSLIKAFTQTSDWILSAQIAPPTIIGGDSHYLCTVSLRGHQKLVKPLRYGMRRNEKIVINRQLCVANAWEQLLQEKMPTVHRKVRAFYDTYGYPISKHIKKPLTADCIYLLMKPLEYFFVICLYLIDPNPENRIASQYLPSDKKSL